MYFINLIVKYHRKNVLLFCMTYYCTKTVKNSKQSDIIHPISILRIMDEIDDTLSLSNGKLILVMISM